ncbi:MAG TPA: Rrf2 family transcriptional regulator, partial [Candidatus Krumholzibacterium sp.]|nr:Rrf2 family transcriptional regulator [Candidatus Krumholzibacterium sp.]
MKLSTRTRYGLRAIVNIAKSADRPISSESIADCESISKKYLDGILAELRKAGLVQSFRGQNGGYMLARHAGEITVTDVIAALEGGIC